MAHFIRNSLLAIVALAAITACGFHLRNDASLPISLQPLYIGGKYGNGAFAAVLRRQLTSSDTKVTYNIASANYQLLLLREEHDQRIISLDSRGLAAEYGLTSSIEFELRDHGGQRVLDPQKIEELRTVTNNPDNALTTAQETSLVREDMDKSLAAQVVRRLGAFAKHAQKTPTAQSAQ